MKGIDDRSGRVSRERVAVLCGAAGLLLLFVLLLALTWLKWGDPVVDTGRELEIPWKIASGDLLYRDMAYNYGPSAPYLNALLLKLFGVHLTVIVFGGALAAAAGMGLVYRVCRFFLGSMASMALSAVFLFECAFQHYYANGNFCFILPYSFPAVHGTLAALGALVALLYHIENPKRSLLATAGLLAGLSLLCKIEIAGAILIPLALVPFLQPQKSKARLKAWAACTAAWAIPCLLVTLAGFLPFIIAASFEQVVWANVFKPQLVDFRSNVFFMQHLGVAGLEGNLAAMAKSFGLWAVAAAGAAGGAFLFAKTRTTGDRRPFTAPRVFALILFAGSAAVAWFLLPYALEFRCLPVVGLLSALLSFRFLLRDQNDRESRSFHAGILALSLFAELSLLRIFLNAGTFHYGFCLALPGVLLFAIFFACLLPRCFPSLFENPRLFGAAMVVLLLLLGGRNFFFVSLDQYQTKTVKLSGPGGTMMAHPMPIGLDIAEAMHHLEEAAGPGDTLLVLPEGAALNFLLQQENPTYFNLFTPPELNAEGVEARVVTEIEREKVDRILIVDRPVIEYGFRGFGIDYGLELIQSILEHYEKEASFGLPYQGLPGGCLVYRRKDGRNP